MQVIEIEISKLNHAEYNPRQITEKQMDKLVKSIEYYGFVEPVVVNKDFTIIGGHQRVKAYEILGNKTIPCTFVDLDKQNEKALNIALNKTGGEFDADMLQSLLTELDMSGLDMDLTGFDSLELEELFNLNTDSDGENETEEFGSKNKEVDTDNFADTMILKLTFCEDDFKRVLSALADIADTPEQAVLSLIDG